MAMDISNCKHMGETAEILMLDLVEIHNSKKCVKCNKSGENIWLCLNKHCLQLFCSELNNNHTNQHFNLNSQHCVYYNPTTEQVYCFYCNTLEFLEEMRKPYKHTIENVSSNNDNYINLNKSDDIGKEYNDGFGNHKKQTLFYSNYEDNEMEFSEGEDFNAALDNGLVGLENISNTCFMNAAIQALSNLTPLRYYFLECSFLIQSKYKAVENNISLAKCYLQLMRKIWCSPIIKEIKFISPREICTTMQKINPMFIGFDQHDTQEFLKCFIDRLHEELKEATPVPPDHIIRLLSANSSYATDSYYSYEDDQIDNPTSFAIALQLPSLDGQYPLESNDIDKSSSYASDIVFGNQPLNKICEPIYNHFQSSLVLKDRSIISDLFDGQLISYVQCLTCNRTSMSEETFKDLLLPIPAKEQLNSLYQEMQAKMSHLAPSVNAICCEQGGLYCTIVHQSDFNKAFWFMWDWIRSIFNQPKLTLEHCIFAFFSADKLIDDNMYNCENCETLCNGVKYSKILQLPEVLCIHLKRFTHDLENLYKITTFVSFPLTNLDLKPFLHEDCKSKISTYELISIICHHGTPGTGHYTCYSKHELKSNWYEYNDHLVTQVSEETVRNCQAYVLFYRKINLNMPIFRNLARKFSYLDSMKTNNVTFYVSQQWLNRFHTFAEPGPIDNWTILCPHGGIDPNNLKIIFKLLVPVSQALWDFLYEKFGGGPALNKIIKCDICHKEEQILVERQNYEFKTFTDLHMKFCREKSEIKTLYALSMEWFCQWQSFVHGLTLKVPGAVDNMDLVECGDQNQTEELKIKPESDYAQFDVDIWKFFLNIYGGGPEIIINQFCSKDDEKKNVANNNNEESKPLIDLSVTYEMEDYDMFSD